jgi:anaerobic sulfite reductase subunit A
VSDCDYVGYRELFACDELVTDVKSYFSPKEAVFPAREVLFTFNSNETVVPAIDEKPVIIFLRACDINGFDRLDTIFLRSGNDEDFYYKRRRDKIHFFLIECAQSFNSCFCVSMNTNTTGNYDVALRFTDDNVAIQVKNSMFESHFRNGEPCDFMPRFITENNSTVTVPDASIDEKIFFDPLWDEYTRRCIACGRCNTSCVTCTCFTMQDYSAGSDNSERRRRWASCHVEGFTDMAGGHSFRKKHGDKMRFKTMHKISDFKRRFGVNMCVGCGRCDDVCPEYISFAECIRRVSKLTDQYKNDTSKG